MNIYFFCEKDIIYEKISLKTNKRVLISHIDKIERKRKKIENKEFYHIVNTLGEC